MDQTAGLDDITSNQPPAQPTAPIPPQAAATAPDSQLSYFRPQIPSTNPLLRLIGAAIGKTPMNYGQPVATTNVSPNSDTSKQLGLPDVAPVGKDAKGNPLYDYAEATRRNEDIASLKKMQALRGLTNPTFTDANDLSQASGGLFDPKTAQGMIDAHGGAYPMSELKTALTGAGTKGRVDLSSALTTRAQAQLMNTIYKMGGGDYIQKAGSQAMTNVLAAKKAQALVDQIDSQGGQANIRQRTELAASLGQLAGSGQGQLTDEKMNQFIPDTLRGKVAGWQEWWSNSNANMDFSGFLPQMKDMLNREMDANQSFANNAAQYGTSIANQVRPGSGNIISTARANNPILGTQPGGVNAPAAPQQTGSVDMTGKVRMVRPDGVVVAVPAQNILKARARGYKVQ